MLDLLFALALTAQAAQPDTALQSAAAKPAPVRVSKYEAGEHWLDDRFLYLRAKVEESNVIIVETTVDSDGSVVSAKASRKVRDTVLPSALFEQAEALVRKLRFKPFERGGHSVSAVFELYVSLLPPELTVTRHVPFPKVRDWKSVKITFARTAGQLKYSVEIHGDGTVLYKGQDFVVFTGSHRGSVPQANVIDLVKSFEQADYFSLRDEYLSDRASVTIATSIEFDGRRKQVVDSLGEKMGMPTSVRKLENSIMVLSGALRWTQGNDETLAALQAEHWDFKSTQAADTLARAADLGNTQLVRDLVLAGVPLNGKAVFAHLSPLQSAVGDMEKPLSPLQSAAGRGDLAMLGTLLQAGAGANPQDLASALTKAAGSGKVEALRLLLDSGAGINARDAEGHTVLMAAAASGSPAMVKEVLKNHADVNAGATPPPRSCSEKGLEREGCPKWALDDGRTALMMAVESHDDLSTPEDLDRVEVVRLLLAAGADVNANDKYDNTALILCADVQQVSLLLQAGADLNARNFWGKTALSSHYYDDAIKRLLIEHGAVQDEESK